MGLCDVVLMKANPFSIFDFEFLFFLLRCCVWLLRNKRKLSENCIHAV